jgi:VWFA-related protein
VNRSLHRTALVSIFLWGASLAGVAQQPSSVPDAPAPQPTPAITGASGVTGPITPGIGAGETGTNGTAATGSSSSTSTQPPPSTTAPPAPDNFQKAPPEMPAPGEGVEKVGSMIRLNVNFVEVPVTVKDPKGKLVPGLTWRDFKVFENGQREQLRVFTADPAPLSMAFVIDQSVTSDVMARVNDSLNSIQGALTPYDEIAIFSYTHLATEQTGFTGAQSARVPYVIAQTKSAGAEELVPINSGPFDSCGIHENGACVDPNLQAGKSAGSGYFMTIPKEVHPLNDAILKAAKELSSRPKERRRIIYVVSDGKEAGSKATYKEVLKYLETNNITVYGTLVGDSARWGEGYLSKFHLPFTMYDNRLTAYVLATGGTLDSERGVNGMETSYAKLAEEARVRYTLGYYTSEPFIDGKFRKIEVRVERPGLEVYSKDGYYPSARDSQ